MDELEAIRQRKIEELQSAQSEQLQEQLQQQQVEQLESAVKQAMTKEALERFGNIKAAHPEKAVQLLVVLAQMLQSGQLKQINDDVLKEILTKLQPEKKEFNIRKK